METNGIAKIEKVTGILKQYVIPVVAWIAAMAVGWALMSNTVTSNSVRLEKLEVRAEENDDIHSLILQRLSSIDTKLEYIIKELDKLGD